jgi:hypothetical protein
MPTSSHPPADLPKFGFVFLLAQTFGVGGIETLFLRLAGELRDLGYRVAIVSLFASETSLDPGGITTLSLNEMKAQMGASTSGENLIIASDPITYALAITHFSQPNVRIVTGIFHPRAFSRADIHPAARALIRALLKLSHHTNTFFMSEATRKEHELAFGQKFSNRPVVKLLLQKPQVHWRPQKSEVFHILSIGRIVRFKAYNWAAADITLRLNQAGIPARWDIFGYGPDETDLDQLIKNHPGAEYVRFRGLMAYEKMNRTLLEYDAFVGMGTAALEAAFVGLPTLVAADSLGEKCLGFFSDVASDAIGEVSDLTALKDVEAELLKIAQMTEPELVQVSQRHIAKALSYSSKAEDFLAVGAQSENSERSRPMSLQVLARAISIAAMTYFRFWRGKQAIGDGPR